MLKLSRHQKQKLALFVTAFFSFILLGSIFYVYYTIIRLGASSITWTFLFDIPREGMTQGGIFPAILGTTLVTFVTTIFAIPIGVGTAIYLNEYAIHSWWTRLIRISIRNLAGVPSIVYGLFGVVLFVRSFHLGTSVFSAGLTLGLLTLPNIITASEEALKTVPKAFRDGSYALGANKWQTIYKNVLPYATPGLLTGAILGLSRAAGETAPILFTGAAFFIPGITFDLTKQFMALPYHLYIMSTQHHNIELVRPIAYGTALVLISLVAILNLMVSLIRSRYHIGKGF